MHVSQRTVPQKVRKERKANFGLRRRLCKLWGKMQFSLSAKLWSRLHLGRALWDDLLKRVRVQKRSVPQKSPSWKFSQKVSFMTESSTFLFENLVWKLCIKVGPDPSHGVQPRNLVEKSDLTVQFRGFIKKVTQMWCSRAIGLIGLSYAYFIFLRAKTENAPGLNSAQFRCWLTIPG